LLDVNLLRSYLSEPNYRAVLSEIIHSHRSRSIDELSSLFPSLTSNYSLTKILKKFVDIGIIKSKKISLGSQEREFYFPNRELLRSNFYRDLLLEYEDLNYPSKLDLEFTYLWEDWPQCLVDNGSLTLYIVTSTYLPENVDIAHLTKLLTVWALKYAKLSIENIHISNIVDIKATPVKTNNLIVIGSGEVNKVTADILSLYGDSLPIRFQSKSIYSSLTSRNYSSTKGSIVGLLPNPWNPSKIALICSSMSYFGTNISLKALIDDLDSVIHQEPRILSNHSVYSEIPIRVLASEENNKNKEKLEGLKSYTFKE